MLTRSFACAIPLILTEAVSAAPLHLPSRRENFNPPAYTRLEFVNVANPFNFDVVDLDGDGAIIYVANITVDGISYEVQLDTGSSDLWLNTQNTTLSSAANDTGISTTIVYGDTTVATGDIYVAAAQFGNFSIPSQAFINAPGSNATSDNDLGLIGLSTRNISEIYSSLENTSYDGNPLLYNIFSTYPNVSNYMTFLLARSNLGITEGGVFTIGEVDPGWSAVQNQTKIPVVAGLQQWIGLTDGIVVNGKNYSGHGLLSEVEGVPKDLRKKTLSLLDSGTSLGTLPPHYWDAVYGNIEGIQVYDEENGIFSVPCDTKLNVSIVFNGTEYPINPLDLTQLMTTGNFSNGTNETLCVNAFVPAEMSDQGFDIILGDTFMRNVYALFNFGNWTALGDEPPFIQLLSTTNQSEAWAQFDDLNAARIQQWNQLMGSYNLTSSSSGKSSSAWARKTSRMTPMQTSQDVSAVEEAVKTYNHWVNSP